MLSERFANANGLVAKMPRTVEATPGRGAGGLMTGVAGRERRVRQAVYVYARRHRDQPLELT
jgi:hypothetical protein